MEKAETVVPAESASSTQTVVPDLHAYLGEFDPFALKPLAGRWESAGVKWIVGVGNDVASSEAAVDAAWSLRDTVAGVGLHPKRLPADGVSTAAQLDDLAVLAELATDPQVAVISDVGVDVTVDAPRSLQDDVFNMMLDVAVASSRSMLVHWNAPITDLLEVWDAHPKPPPAALLAFAGDAAQARELLDRGFYFSISPEAVGLSGPATTPAEVLSGLPAERLFVHSNTHADDGGAGVGPDVVLAVLQRLAAQREVEAEALAGQINTNLWQFLTWRSK